MYIFFGSQFLFLNLLPWCCAVDVWLQVMLTARSITNDQRPLPPSADDPVADEELLSNEPWIEPPIRVDYGYNVKVGQGAFINYNCTIIDTCLVTIGDRTLFGPNVNLYSGMHPLDPELRNGTNGPEMGKEIHIGADCWIGGNVTVLPGVTIGRGSTVGAGSVVTKVSRLESAFSAMIANPSDKDVPPFHVVAGNPARILRKVETAMADEMKR